MYPPPDVPEGKSPTTNALAMAADASPTAVANTKEFVRDDDDTSNEASSKPNSDNSSAPQLSAIRLTLVMIAVYLSILCVALDNTIIATAIPRITDTFHSIDDVGWYGSAYLMSEAALQPFFGRIYTKFELKYVYLIAVAIFEVGSVLCGAAPLSAVFILGRAIAGVGSAGVFSGVALIISRTVPLAQRPIYFGAFSAIYGLATSVGPILGGALATNVTWRLCFYINLPLGAITVAFIILVYKPEHHARESSDKLSWKTKLGGLDYTGTLCFLSAIICLFLALQWRGEAYPWKNPRIIATLTLSGALFIAFCVVQWKKQEKATIPPRILRQRSVAAATWFGFCTVGSMFSMVYFLPLWFQAIKGVDPLQSGFRTIALNLSLTATSMTAGVLISRWAGYYNPFMIASSVLASVGAGMLSLLTVKSHAAAFIGFQILYGIGIGLGMQQSLLVVQTVLTDGDNPIGTALINLAQTLGGAVSISVASNLSNTALEDGLRAAVPGLNVPRLVASGATNIRDLVAARFLPDVLQVYNNALTHTFRVPTALAALSILGALTLQWRSVRRDVLKS